MVADNTKKKQVTRKQHWLPRVYLKEFMLDDKLNVYDFSPQDGPEYFNRAKHESGITPNGVAHIKDLYEMPDLPVNTIEDAFGQLEDLYGPIVQKIKNQEPLIDEERDQLALFVTALQNRTPRQRDHVKDFVDRVEKMGRQVSVAHGHPEAGDRFAEELKGVRDEIFGMWIGTSLDVDHWGALDFAFMHIDENGPFREMEFFTSDHPVSLVDLAGDNTFYGVHPWGKTSESVVPLTPKIALFGNRAGITGYHDVDANFIREINKRTLSASGHLLISASELEAREMNGFSGHHRQSLLLKTMDIPDGRGEELMKQADQVPEEI